MTSNMEGNWQMLQAQPVGKPTVINGSTPRFKRTFPFDHTTGRLLVTGVASADEVLLQQNSEQYTGIKLMRGLWQEKMADTSGTYFPVAAPAGEGVMWGSAGHCLMPSKQRQWRYGYGTDVLPSDPSIKLAGRSVVDLGWLTQGLDASELAEVTPSQPMLPLADAEVMPDFGFMLTTHPTALQQLFIPCARQLLCGDAVCLLGFASRPTGDWSRTFLRTEADYELALQNASLRHQELLPNWKLDPNEALDRVLDLLDDVCYPSRLVASPGLVAAASGRIVEHTCSTFLGMSGAPGVDIQTPWKLLFVHTRADSDFRRNNYGYSVNHPLFVKAYVREVLPRLLATPSQLLSQEMTHCLYEYLHAHEHELEDRNVLEEVVQRLGG